jgi:hypothetical protein
VNEDTIPKNPLKVILKRKYPQGKWSWDRVASIATGYGPEN